ncbi:DoxX family protein [Nocardia sp. NPDC005366]|uniref:DoxX family protein n=1 Tax=Nocardia sp. NPDC005366 TaxID=3156878 RepID=UPI0033AC642A
MGTTVSNRPVLTAPAASQSALDLGLLIIRAVVGVTMAGHGTQKLFGWFDGNGISGTGRFFESSGYPQGETMAVIAGLSEFLGGIGLVVGLVTPLAAAAILGVMINAIAVKGTGEFFGQKGIEYDLVLACTAAGLALTGPGRVALDHYLPGLRYQRLGYGIAAIVLAVVTAAVVLVIRG